MLFRRRPRPAVDPEAASLPFEIPGLTGGRTVIGRQTRVTGTLSGEGPVVVWGDLKGTIAIRGGLSVKDGGHVEADVSAHSVELAGEAHGTMRATTRVSLTATGAFDGEMDTPILDVTPGSIVCGHARIAGHGSKGARTSH